MPLHNRYLILYADGTFEPNHLAIREDLESDQIFTAFDELERRYGSKVAMLIPINCGPETQA